MKPSYFAIQYSLCSAVCLCALSPSIVLGQEKNPSNATSPPRKPLTPEERQERSLAKQMKENEAKKMRLETFGVIPEDDNSPLAASYRAAVKEFRTATAEFSDAHSRMFYRLEGNLEESQRYAWLEKLNNNYAKLFAFRNAAADLVLSDPVRYESVALMLRDMLVMEVASDRSDHWARGARAVLSCQQLITDDVLLHAGYAGFIDADWELVTTAWSTLAESGKLPEVEQQMLATLPEMQANWEQELNRRKEDEQKNNPRVEILTSKGIIEVELFEDDAPESVASFIYLIENGYYNRKPFFLVRRHFVSQTGCEKGDGKGNAGYTIRFEGDAPTFRRHFRGSLAIPLGVDDDTKEVNLKSGGAQFYIAFSPIPILDGRHTVFGRIVKNIEFLGLLKEVDLTDEEKRKDPHLHPDRIISAKVLRKRDREYLPTPIVGKLPR
ncbi:MAG: peptidylprolyl isomerase [Planctomycetes bacterium]|nr:peptidylprolyl isomerase [Planctomycetota bacterium]